MSVIEEKCKHFPPLFEKWKFCRKFSFKNRFIVRAQKW